MAYDHARKFGNEGDVVKHTVLHNVVLHLLESNSDACFNYADSHCGRPSYTLSPTGDWKDGVGHLSKTTKESREPRPFIRSYWDEHLCSPLTGGRSYYGSSNIVFRVCRSRGKKLHFDLFETDPHAHDDLRRFFFPWNEVVIHQRDGYSGVCEVDNPSLVLVDPSSLDLRNIPACIQRLRDKTVPYICWTPRNSSNQRDFESQDSIAFGQMDLGTHLSVRWANPSGAGYHTFGCRLTVSDDIAGVARASVTELVELLSEIDPGWRLDQN
jgi:23S rRNA A2030 N6-methylase RlmJ